jgi:hypothetical protein
MHHKTADLITEARILRKRLTLVREELGQQWIVFKESRARAIALSASNAPQRRNRRKTDNVEH